MWVEKKDIIFLGTGLLFSVSPYFVPTPVDDYLDHEHQ